jgi:hypothetical protein
VGGAGIKGVTEGVSKGVPSGAKGVTEGVILRVAGLAFRLDSPMACAPLSHSGLILNGMCPLAFMAISVDSTREL